MDNTGLLCVGIVAQELWRQRPEKRKTSRFRKSSRRSAYRDSGVNVLVDPGYRIKPGTDPRDDACGSFFSRNRKDIALQDPDSH